MPLSISFTSDTEDLPTARYFLEKLSLEKSILWHIRLYTLLYFTLPVSDVLII